MRSAFSTSGSSSRFPLKQLNILSPYKFRIRESLPAPT
jgi:hypothetical protein